MSTMWMIRGEGGSLYDDFREKSLAAIGWSQLAANAKPGMTRQELTTLYQSIELGIKQKNCNFRRITGMALHQRILISCEAALQSISERLPRGAFALEVVRQPPVSFQIWPSKCVSQSG